MAFLETPRFPDSIAMGSRGGPTFRTSIVVLGSGYESRNVNWTYARHYYDVGYGIRSLDDLEELIEFFHAVGGRAYGFRFKDLADYKSVNTSASVSPTDQTIGTGDNSETDFQLIKTYVKGAFSRARNITKPVSGTVRVALDGVEQAASPPGWSVATTTGIVSFDSPPGNNVVVSAGFEFDVPVRFDTDQLEVNLDEVSLASAQVPIIEIRDIT